MVTAAEMTAIVDEAKASFGADFRYLESVLLAGHRARSQGFPKSPESSEPEKSLKSVEPAWEGFEPPETPQWERVLKKISVGPGGCWVWSGGLGGPQNNRQPYAMLNGRVGPVRRWAYAEMHGIWPVRSKRVKTEDTCDLLCVRPDHLHLTSGSQAGREAKRAPKRSA